MTRRYDTATYKKLLLHFMGEADPLCSMLQWLKERMMEVEAELKAGATKGKHTPDRTTHFSGTRVRRFDTRLGTLYLLVPKLSQGDYVPFFVIAFPRPLQRWKRAWRMPCSTWSFPPSITGRSVPPIYLSG